MRLALVAAPVARVVPAERLQKVCIAEELLRRLFMEAFLRAGLKLFLGY